MSTELLRYNLWLPQQFAEVTTNKVVMARCPTFVRDAVELVKNII